MAKIAKIAALVWGAALCIAAPRAQGEDSMTQGFLASLGTGHFEIRVGNDNQNSSLPPVFKSWWYVGLNGVPTDRETTIKVVARGHNHYYLPVYSYDQKTWLQFAPQEVVSVGPDLLIKKRFSSGEVFVARSEPYSYQRLQGYLDQLRGEPMVELGEVGKSPSGVSIPYISITRPRTQSGISLSAKAFLGQDQGIGKKRVFLHARTHPGETATSFVLEGFISYLIHSSDATQALANYIVTIVPMHNVDGVINGNNRTNARSENLEELWHFDAENPIRMAPQSPVENQALARLMTEFQSGPAPIKVALNLHSTNGEPEFYPHFIPHFGLNPQKYREEERSLFAKQKSLADYWFQFMAFGRSALPVESNPLFLEKSYPETWFWRQFQDRVLAVTFESTYGHVPGSNEFFSAIRHREMGRGLAKAVLKYLASDTSP